MTTLDREDFTENVGIQAMRNAWRDGWTQFDADREAMYPMDAVLEKAQAAMVVEEKLRPGGQYVSPEGFSGDSTPRHADLPCELDSKICHLCGDEARNNPCDGCYSLGRLVMGAGYVQGLQDGGFPRFCVVCFDDTVSGMSLCISCLNLLRGAFPL